jgi:signal transduction histidine kinase
VRLGLRERLVVVLVLVSALTLIVAAVALFSPLDSLVRRAARDSLAQSLRAQRVAFAGLPAGVVRAGDPRLLASTRGLRRTGAEVAVLDADGRVLVATDPEPGEWTAQARRALRSHGEYQAITGRGAEAEVEAALPVQIGTMAVIVAARRQLDDVDAVTGVVRRAFGVAALVGLLAAVLVGWLIARRMAQRLQRLRDSAERVAQVGPVAEFQPERGADEIGDLSRSFGFMQRRLREQEQARRAFVATASHELRTPVTSLQIMLDLLISDLEAQPPAVADALRQARGADEQALRLSQLAAELLDLSRIDAGVPARREPVELGEVLRSVVAELELRLAAQGRTVTLGGRADGWALGDPDHVARIVRILLDNALRHTPPSGRVRGELTGNHARAGIAVQDDGPGVAVEDRERIFERFARGQGAQAGGFGLGLAIARELARRMDGDLVLEETDVGARFVLWLAVADSCDSRV